MTNFGETKKANHNNNKTKKSKHKKSLPGPEIEPRTFRTVTLRYL